MLMIRVKVKKHTIIGTVITVRTPCKIKYGLIHPLKIDISRAFLRAVCVCDSYLQT